MNDTQLDRALQSVGMITFIAYLDKFQDESLTHKDLVDMLESDKNNNYKKGSIIAKVSNGRLICRMSRDFDALKVTAFASHAGKPTIARARLLLAECNQ
ncbi:MAG: hypothetical protein HOC17_03810 [Candidatus Ruthia sp.]|jgi:hypothetical protein|nr:hypothetical protein [Candidatus Ruthturnera sp.]